MRKDPTEFRKRFQSWKLGMPAYEDGKPIDYTKAAQESRDREYNTAMSYFKSTPNVLNIAKGVYHFAKSTPLFGDTPASVNPNMIYGDAPAVGYRNPARLAETTRRIKAAVKPFVNGVSNTKLSTQALQQEIRYGDTYYPKQLTIAERNAMAKLRQSKLAKEKGKYVMVDNAPKVGLKNYVLMENGKPQAEMIASMEDGSIIPEMVYKTNKTAHNTTTDLYSGVLKYLKQAGNTGGIISGESYKSAPATLKQVKKFKKEKVSDDGTWDNEGLVGYDQEPTVVKTMEEADELNKKGKTYILYNQPVYRLLQPVKDIPIKDRYMFDPRRIGPNGEYNIDMSNPSRFAQNQDDSNLRHYFKGGKDLPRFRGGNDGTRYVPTDDGWGRITDSDVANLMENWVVTPLGVRNKFDYEYNPNYKQPIGKNAAVRQDNNAWTRQRVAEESNKRSWLSDAADVSHAIGEGAMLASTFAAPEVESLVYPAYQAAKSAATNAMRSSASRVLMNPRNFLFGHIELPPYEILNIPGYQLKMLMRDNPLEKQLSKDGTISVNNIRAQANKASNVEKSVIEKILSSNEFSGLKSVDYNKFRKAVHDELITYDRIPDGRYEDYGMDRLGFRERHIWDMENDPRFEGHVNPLDNVVEFYHRDTGDLVTRQERIAWLKEGLPKTNTFTFESPRIGIGNDKHYDYGTLGHSRTYTTQEEPDILHVMESQSDWGLDAFKLPRFSYNVATNGNTNIIIDEAGNALFVGSGEGIPQREFLNITDRHNPNNPFNIANRQFKKNTSIEQAKYLHDNYTHRQILENLKYAAEHGLTKMRYPTSDTAAKIEGYKKGFTRSDETEAISKLISDAQDEYERLVKLDRDPFDDKDPVNIRLDELVENLKKLRALFDDAITRTPLDYSSEHKTILKKYADFPKQFKKLHKNAEVREVTDGKGNTWYEVDVPKDFLNKEWMYGIGAGLVGGAASVNYDWGIPGFKNGKDIYIKPSHRGRFTALKKRTGHSASWFKAHGTPALKKMATFALNARKWKH